MNQHLAIAIAIYEEAGTKFTDIFNWHLCYGVVVSCFDYFCMCYPAQSNFPLRAVERHHANTLFVTFATGDMRRGLEQFCELFDYIAFQRSFKNSDKIRIYDMQLFYSKLR
jgi:hypothetical protein